jgi:hypothetical protein
LNTDVAIDLGARKTSAGCMIRDSYGQFMGACRQEVVGVIDITTAEAQALHTKHIGCNKIHAESDCMEAIQALADSRNNRIVGSAYLDECRMILAGVNTTRIAHYPRNLNKVAHLVARYKRSRYKCMVRWFAFVPSSTTSGRCNLIFKINKVCIVC